MQHAIGQRPARVCSDSPGEWPPIRKIAAIEQIVERALLWVDGAGRSSAWTTTLRPVFNNVAGFRVTLRDTALDRFYLDPSRVASTHNCMEYAPADRDANDVTRCYRIKSHEGRS